MSRWMRLNGKKNIKQLMNLNEVIATVRRSCRYCAATHPRTVRLSAKKSVREKQYGHTVQLFFEAIRKAIPVQAKHAS